MPALVRGIILAWHGDIVDIPAGFVICDGTLGTPDLTDKFIIGAGGSLNPDDQGGSENHSHEFTGDGHFHSLTAGPNVGPGAAWDNDTTIESVTGITAPVNHIPPYYALAYIMKT